jgi:DNA-binding transcriptional regulator YhcF (GntR family)
MTRSPLYVSVGGDLLARPRERIEIPAVFRGPRVLTLDQLGQKLAVSRRTVLRRLAEHGYCTSYNLKGRFLTIKEVAAFDSRGLWLWNTARFSEHGTLKETARHFIERAERGLTHEEVSELLGVRVHNALLELVEQEVVYREKLGPAFVYVSMKQAARRNQLRRRITFMEGNRRPRPTIRQVIATLLEFINNPQASRAQIVGRCQRVGIAILPATVDRIFETYDLDKKRALSRSSTSSKRSAGRPRPN